MKHLASELDPDGERIDLNKECLPYYTHIHGGWPKVTFEFCVQKCKESESCGFANWQSSDLHVGQCQLSKANCVVTTTNRESGLDRLWQKSKFLKYFSTFQFTALKIG